MGLFEKMLDQETRQAFLAYKGQCVFFPAAEVEAMRPYLLSDRCTEDIRRLMAGDYFFRPPQQFIIRRTRSGQKRLVHSFDPEEKTILRLMAHILRLDYDNVFSDGLYSCRSFQGVPELIQRLKYTPGLEQMYILRTDVYHYGDSVDGDVLLEELEKLLGEDKAAVDFFRWLLRWRMCRLPDGTVCRAAPPLMSGMPLTSFFENLYLSGLDWHFQRLGAPYGRYADDIILYADSREQLEEHLRYLEAETARRRLRLNGDKTLLLPPGTPVEVLGMKLTGRQVDIADAAVDKLRWKMHRFGSRLQEEKRRRGLSDDEAMERMIRFADRKFFGSPGGRHELCWSHWAMPLINTTEGLERLDRIIQDAIRYAGSGKLSNARYRIRYKKLRQLGYRSLVHAYYHRHEAAWDEREVRQRFSRTTALM